MNINEIAKLAGVSRATVSRYLNDGYVSGEKKEAIRQVIEKTGYEPSTQAQNLRRKVTKLIGVIVPKLQSETVGRMVDGISQVLSEQGYGMLLASTGNDIKEELKYLKMFQKNQVDGVLLLGTTFSKAHLQAIKEQQVPVVVLGQQMEQTSCVYQDDYQASKVVTQELLKTGHFIGYIGANTKDNTEGSERRKGFTDVMNQQSEKTITAMLEGDTDVSTGYEKAQMLMRNFPKTDSIFCATDSLAVGALKCLKDRGISVPQQVQIMGFGDNLIGQVVSPALSTIHFYYHTSGKEAAKLLLEIIENGQDHKKALKMGFEIKENGTTRKA